MVSTPRKLEDTELLEEIPVTEAGTRHTGWIYAPPIVMNVAKGIETLRKATVSFRVLFLCTLFCNIDVSRTFHSLTELECPCDVGRI